MKFAILYFSGTGVTAKFADDLAHGLLEEKHSVDLFRLKKWSDIDLSAYDIIGVGSPAYSFRIPWLVTRILRKLDFKKKPFFVFCTSGGMSGNALWNLYRAIKKTTGPCLGYTQGIGITNLRMWMPRESEEDPVLWGLNQTHCENARKYGVKTIDRLKEWQINPTKKQESEWKPRFSFQIIIWSLLFTWRWQMAATVGIKRIDKEKCTKCGLCATKICPSKAITMKNDQFPKINQWKCIGCNGCVNLCPEDAIWSYLTRKHIQYDLYEEYILKK
jgi:Pyruvate/2-oxoacid:ferredoxin oxidoreductase delta subunit/flavodoxin